MYMLQYNIFDLLISDIIKMIFCSFLTLKHLYRLKMASLHLPQTLGASTFSVNYAGKQVSAFVGLSTMSLKGTAQHKMPGQVSITPFVLHTRVVLMLVLYCK